MFRSIGDDDGLGVALGAPTAHGSCHKSDSLPVTRMELQRKADLARPQKGVPKGVAICTLSRDGQPASQPFNRPCISTGNTEIYYLLDDGVAALLV